MAGAEVEAAVEATVETVAVAMPDAKKEIGLIS